MLQIEQQEPPVFFSLRVSIISLSKHPGGEYFHEFEYEDWEEVDITRPVPLWICLLLVFGILFGGNSDIDRSC